MCEIYKDWHRECAWRRLGKGVRSPERRKWRRKWCDGEKDQSRRCQNAIRRKLRMESEPKGSRGRMGK